jgi:hypothetical protein
MKSRLSVLTASLVVVACSDARLPTQPTTPAPGQTPTSAITAPAATPPNGANWVADATVLSVTGTGGCGSGITMGETRTGVWWRITQNGDSITLDEDMANWPTDDTPFSGSLSGTQFVAADVESGGGVCQFRGGQLVGSFSADGQSFDATEVLLWGPLESPVRVQRHWTGRRL